MMNRVWEWVMSLTLVYLLVGAVIFLYHGFTQGIFDIKKIFVWPGEL